MTSVSMNAISESNVGILAIRGTYTFPITNKAFALIHSDLTAPGHLRWFTFPLVDSGVIHWVHWVHWCISVRMKIAVSIPLTDNDARADVAGN
jgi:phosphatidylethanolamine-binding protein (PEBP) family uncharacterized protein